MNYLTKKVDFLTVFENEGLLVVYLIQKVEKNFGENDKTVASLAKQPLLCYNTT